MLADLAPELLDQVLSRVDPVSTAFLGCTNSRFKSIVDNSTTWERHCKNRWTHLNYGLPERDGKDLKSSNNKLDRATSRTEQKVVVRMLCGRAAGSWRSAYSERNGWNSPKVTRRYTTASQDARSFAIADGPAGEELLLITTLTDIEVGPCQSRLVHSEARACARTSLQLVTHSEPNLAG